VSLKRLSGVFLRNERKSPYMFYECDSKYGLEEVFWETWPYFTKA